MPLVSAKESFEVFIELMNQCGGHEVWEIVIGNMTSVVNHAGDFQTVKMRQS